MARVTLVTKDWLNQAQAELASGLDRDEPDEGEDDHGTASDLLNAKLITAQDIAKALDAPCERCRRAEATGKRRHACRGIGCNRWSARRARRWMRRSQCPQRPGDPLCEARRGGACACTVGVQLWPGGVWTTTLSRLRERFPDVAELVLIHQDEG